MQHLYSHQSHLLSQALTPPPSLGLSPVTLGLSHYVKGPVVRFSASGRSLDTNGRSFNLQTCISASRWSGLSRTHITRSVYLAKRTHSHSSVRSIPWQRCIITVPKNRRQTKESNLQAHKHGQPMRSAGSTLHLGFNTLYSAEHSFMTWCVCVFSSSWQA